MKIIIVFRKNLRMGYLEQSPTFSRTASLFFFLKRNGMPYCRL